METFKCYEGGVEFVSNKQKMYIVRIAKTMSNLLTKFEIVKCFQNNLDHAL
jgi:hypothetical protein